MRGREGVSWAVGGSERGLKGKGNEWLEVHESLELFAVFGPSLSGKIMDV